MAGVSQASCFNVLTGEAVPLVDCKEPVCSDRDHGGSGQAGLGVGSHVSDRGVGGELEDHDHILLGLLCEHQGALQEEILLSAHDKNPNTREKRTWGGEETGQEKEDRIKTHEIR